MKILKFITAMFSSLLLLSACSQEESINSIASDNLDLKLRVSNSVLDKRTRATGVEPVSKESTISNVHVFFFQDDALDTNEPAYFYEEKGMSNSGSWEKSFVKSLTGLKDNTKYDVYVLANIPTSVSVSSKITKGELLALTEAFAGNRQIDGSDISFSGTSTFLCGTDSEILIDLERTVARLDITVNLDATLGTDWEIQSVAVNNENASTFYFTGGVVKNGVDRKTDKGMAWKVGNLYRYYTYENASSSEEAQQLFLLITLGNKAGDVRTYKAIVNNTGDGLVQRNYIYKVVLTLKNSLPVPVDMVWTVVPFNDVNIDASVQATFLDLSRSIIPADNLYGGVLGIKTNAQTVHVDMNGAKDFVLSSYEEQSSVDLIPDSLGQLFLHFFPNESHSVINDGTVTVYAGNLKKSVTLKEKESSVILNHVSAHIVGGPEITDGTVLPWDVYRDQNDGKSGLIELTVNRNCTWHYILYVYSKESGDNPIGTPIAGQFMYDGNPGEQKVSINLFPADEFWGETTVVIEVLYGLIHIDAVLMYSLKFKVEAAK